MLRPSFVRFTRSRRPRPSRIPSEAGGAAFNPAQVRNFRNIRALEGAAA